MTPRPITLLISIAVMYLFHSGHATTVGDGKMRIRKDHLRQYLEDFFSEKRSDAQMEEKQRVRQAIMTYFEKINPIDHTNRWEISYHHYWNEDKNLNGTNIILLIKGERYGTSDDQISLVGAHYDSTQYTAGVDDNGSGMAAMLEIAHALATMIKSGQCTFLNTIIVAAFDHEEHGLVGSQEYVKYLDTEILQKFGVKNFTGAFILETIMNYDTTKDSQKLPRGFNVLFTEENTLLTENEFRGDFLASIVRQNDIPIARLLSEQWYDIVGGDFNSTSKYRQLDLALKLSGSPNEWPVDQLGMLRDFLRSDHTSFWNHQSSYTQDGLKAVFITDTADFRGIMQTCYHNACDDLSKVNDDKLEFLQTGAEAVLRSLTILSTGSQDSQCLNSAAMPGFSFILLITTILLLTLFGK